MRRMNRAGMVIFDTMHKFVLHVVVVGACVLASGCKAPPTWSAESRSPDGKLIATAKTFENSGFGTGGIWTGVYLNWFTKADGDIGVL